MFKDKELISHLVTEQNVKIEFLCRCFKIPVEIRAIMTQLHKKETIRLIRWELKVS